MSLSTTREIAGVSDADVEGILKGFTDSVEGASGTGRSLADERVTASGGPGS